MSLTKNPILCSAADDLRSWATTFIYSESITQENDYWDEEEEKWESSNEYECYDRLIEVAKAIEDNNGFLNDEDFAFAKFHLWQMNPYEEEY